MIAKIKISFYKKLQARKKDHLNFFIFINYYL